MGKGWNQDEDGEASTMYVAMLLECPTDNHCRTANLRSEKRGCSIR